MVEMCNMYLYLRKTSFVRMDYDIEQLETTLVKIFLHIPKVLEFPTSTCRMFFNEIVINCLKTLAQLEKKSLLIYICVVYSLLTF